MASPAIISRSTCRRLRPSGNRLRLISQGTPCSSGSSWVLLPGVWRRARLPASLYRRAASRRDARRAGAGRRDRLAAIIGNAQAQQRMTQVQRIDGLAQSGEIQLAAVEFRIQVGGHAAEEERTVGLPNRRPASWSKLSSGIHFDSANETARIYPNVNRNENYYYLIHLARGCYL